MMAYDEATAWQVVAERVERGRLFHSPYLCDNVHDLFAENRITRTTRNAMLARIDAHINGRFTAYEAATKDEHWASGGFAQDLAEQHRGARALAALWLALEAEEEQG